jgi:hypothetical protein
MKDLIYRLSVCVALLVCSIPAAANTQQALTLDRPIELHLRNATLMLVLGTPSDFH